jgi:hypothetical protein
MLFSPILSAQALDCGEPPPVADEELKGQIEGSAKFLTGWLGQAGFSGQLHSSRKEIFSKYPNANKAQADRYILYQMCIYLKNDDSLTSMEKFDKLLEIRREIMKPVSLD